MIKFQYHSKYAELSTAIIIKDRRSGDIPGAIQDACFRVLELLQIKATRK